VQLLQKCTSVGETEATAFLEKVAKFYRTAYRYIHEYINLKRQSGFTYSKGKVQTVKIQMGNTGIALLFL